MTYHFYVSEAHVSEDGDVINVAFANDHDRTVLFQRNRVPDAQDASLDQDKTYVEIFSQDRSAYGSITEMIIGSRSISLFFNDSSEELLRISGGLEIIYDDAEKLKKALSALAEMMMADGVAVNRKS